jgi:CubicO group peptidase (beta-lactamase class C family)
MTHIESFIREQMRSGQTPGLSVGILADGEMVLSRGYGFADVATRAPMTERSGVVIGSTTKALTCVAILQLAEDGLLRLDDPVIRYLPSFRLRDQAHAAAITIRQAITHTAGLPPTLSTQTEFLFSDDAADDALARYIETLADRVPFGPAGGQWAYANDGFTLAGRIIEVVSGRSYEEYMGERVFAVLGFEDACFAYQPRGEVATAHDFGPDGAPYPSFFPHSRAASAAGSELILSVRDALRWLAAVLDDGRAAGGSLLRQESFAETIRPHFRVQPEGRIAGGAESHYALGWQVARLAGVPMISHGGSTITMGSKFLVLPDQRIAVAVLSNSSSDVNEIVAEGIARILLGGEPSRSFPSIDPSFEPNRSRWPAIAGTYEPQVVQNAVPASLPIELDGVQLVAHTYPADHRRRAGDIFLRPVGDLDFVLSGRGRTGGRATFAIHDGGVDAIWMEVPLKKRGV